MDNPTIQNHLKGIPHLPGIYKYFDEKGQLLYVGKAKDLKKRVAHYFNKNQENYKTAELVKRIRRIDFTIVESEQDALLLENTLIKENKPLFNIDLKDDKTYPYIVIKKESFPRVFLTRRKIMDGSEYLGPFSSVGQVRDLLNLIKELIPLRTCRLNLSEKEILKKKYKVCLEYHLGNCKGPCAGIQTAEDYEQDLEQVRNILRGQLQPVIRYLKGKQKNEIQQLAFEKAALLQKKVDSLENYQARSVIVNPKLGELDVLGIIRYNTMAFLHFLMVRNGSIIRTENVQVECKLDESVEEVLESTIFRIRDKYGSTSPECIVACLPEWSYPGIRFTHPQSGVKKKLLELAEKNAQHALFEFRRKETLLLKQDVPDKPAQTLHALKDALNLPALPSHIECFDNSNFQGSYPVSAMVCFKNGLPFKEDYRHYNIRSVQGINDFASMEEVVYRRYHRLLRESQALPQLIIIDGGKGQLSAAMKSIEALGISNQLTVIGLAKNVEEIFFKGDQDSLKLPYQSEALMFLRRIRDEVHRFGIEFHRQKRSKGSVQSDLENIPGIGKKTIQLLLQTYRSKKGIQEAGEANLATTIGKKKASLVWSYLDKKKGAG